MGADVALMYSGGLDSFVAYHYGKDLGLEVECVYVALGHEYQEKELAAMDSLGIPYTRIDLPWAKVTEPWHVKQVIPARNLLLAMVGSMFADRVWVCGLDGEQFSSHNDKSVEFFGMTTGLLSHVMEIWNPSGTKVESPFLFMTKSDVISWWMDSGRDPSDLFTTTSCWSGDAGKCGTCGTCYKRFAAFLLNNVAEPGYPVNPFTSEYAASQRELLEAPDAALRFSPNRIREHFELIDLGEEDDGP